MDTEFGKVLLLGIGETGLEVTQILGRNKVKGLVTCAIENESGLKPLNTNSIGEEEIVIIVADLGYENENSLAIQASRLTKDQGKVVIAILTTPRLFEGKKNIMRSLETAREIGKVVDSLLIINKETFTVPPENGCSFADLINSLVTKEEIIADSVQSILNLIAPASPINIDLDDLKTTLSESATFTVTSGFGAGEKRISNALEAALSSPLMSKCDIYSSRNILLKLLVSDQTDLSTEEVAIISRFLERMPPYTNVKLGIAKSDTLQGEVELIFLASGFDVKLPEK